MITKALKDQGIILPKLPKDLQPAFLKIDCPKQYCKDARAPDDKEPLKIDFQWPVYAEWKCRHCLWSGHVGDKAVVETQEAGAPRAPSSNNGIDAIDPHHPEIIIVNSEKGRECLGGLGFKNVISLPDVSAEHYDERYDAAPDRFAYLADHAAIFQKVSRVKLALDDGPIELRQELARRIGPGKCWVVTFSKKTLERTLAEMGKDDVCADINEAKPLPIRGLYSIDDFEKELFAYFDGGMAGGVSTSWDNVDQLYTVAPGQLTVVTGIPNSGKSEWVDALTLNIALSHGWRFAAFSPENGKEAHATKLIEKRVELSADPRSKERMSFDTFYSGSKWVRQHYDFIESTQMLPTLDWILERAADAVLRNGIKGLIIDPWNRISKKLEARQSETDYVGEALPRILQFLKNYGVHGWLIVHPNKQEKDRKTGKIPVPSLYDMAGSAHFVNMCDNGIVIHRSDSIDDTTEVHVNKVRFKHIGKRGLTKLSYNVKSGRYVPLDKAPEYLFTDAVDGIKTYEAD